MNIIKYINCIYILLNIFLQKEPIESLLIIKVL